jgi:AraC family transcriptional activator of mtrCDE
LPIPHGVAEGWAPFHIVTAGACLLDIGDRRGIALRAGDIAVLPRGGAHMVRSLPTAGGPALVVRPERRLYDELVVKSNLDGEPDTKFICGRMCFESQLSAGKGAVQVMRGRKIQASIRGKQAAASLLAISGVVERPDRDRCGSDAAGNSAL